MAERFFWAHQHFIRDGKREGVINVCEEYFFFIHRK